MSAVTSTNALAKDSTLQDVADAISTMGATSVGNLSALTTTDKTSLVGAVNEVKSGLIDVTANAYGNYVDLSSYTTDPYTCGSDGYLLMATNTMSTITVYVYGRIGNDYMSVSSINGINTTVYVRKGMRLLVHDTTGTSTVARFYPLVN